MDAILGLGGTDVLIALCQIVFINVVLSADNAIVIGMAAMGLPVRRRMRVLWLGIALATLLRIGFAVVATTLLKVLGLLLAGGILLLWVAWKLWGICRASLHRQSTTWMQHTKGTRPGG